MSGDKTGRTEWKIGILHLLEHKVTTADVHATFFLMQLGFFLPTLLFESSSEILFC